MAKLHFINYKKSRRCDFNIRKLYREAFPMVERAPLFVLKWLAAEGKARLYGIYDQKQFVGMMYNVYYKDIVFIFYFAINDKLRGKGYGSRILQAVTSRYRNHRIILNIEETDPNSRNNEERIRRKEFYKKNGFRSLHYTIKEANVVYEMLCYSEENRTVSKEEYMEMMREYFGSFLFQYVYKKISE